MAEEVGVAFVSLVPSARGFSKIAQRELKSELRGDKTPTITVRPVVDAEVARAELTAQLTGLSRQATVQVAVDVDETETRRRFARSLVSVRDQVRRTEHMTVDADVDAAELLRDTRRAVAVAEAGAGEIDIETDVDRDRARFVGQLLAGAIGGGLQAGGSAVQSGVMTPIQGLASNPLISTAGAAIGIALAIPLGLALAGAIPAAITAGIAGIAGGGVIGLGAFLLKDDPRVKKAAGELSNTVKTTFTAAAEPLAEPFAESLGIIRDLVIELSPQLREMFTAVAPAIKPLTLGFADFVRGVMPGFIALVRASVPVLIQLANSAGPLGKNLGAFFGAIASGAPGAAAFLRDIIGLIGALFKGLGFAIRAGVSWYQTMRSVLGGIAGAWTFVQALTGRAIAFILSALDRIPGAARSAWNHARSSAERFGSWLKGVLPKTITNAVSAFGRLLRDAGGRLIQGLIDGIKDKLGPLGDVLGDAAQFVRDHWPFSPAKTGPLSGRGSLFYAGQNLMTDLSRGIEHRLPTVEAASTQLAGAVQAGVRGGDGAALAPAGITAGWRPGATGDQLLDALRALIEFRYGGSPDAALASR